MWQGVALSDDTLAIKSDDLLNNHLAIILVTPQWHSIK
jgi:hypothetical protein